MLIRHADYCHAIAAAPLSPPLICHCRFSSLSRTAIAARCYYYALFFAYALLMPFRLVAFDYYYVYADARFSLITLFSAVIISLMLFFFVMLVFIIFFL